MDRVVAVPGARLGGTVFHVPPWRRWALLVVQERGETFRRATGDGRGSRSDRARAVVGRRLAIVDLAGLGVLELVAVAHEGDAVGGPRLDAAEVGLVGGQLRA